jgi:two-component system sensor histidine kinase TctE
MTEAPKTPASLATRMGWHVLVPLALVWAVGTGVSVWLAWQSTQRGLDRALVDDAQAIASSVRLAPTEPSGVRPAPAEPGRTDPLAGLAPARPAATPAPPRLVTGLNTDELGFLLFDHDDATFFAIFDGQGRMLAGHPGMVLSDRPEQANAFALRDAVFEGQRVRQATLRKELPAPFYVIAAETTRTRSELWRQLLLYAVLPQGLLLVLLAWWLRRSIVADLQPLAHLSDALAERGAKDLSPVSAEQPNRELVSLAGSVNGLLARLQASIRGHREFVGNVAHELRTPLAGMRALAEHGLAQSEPARWREPLVQIVQVSERASHLTRQLLALALAQEARSEADFVPLQLDDAVREAVLRHQTRARQLGVDLGAEGVEEGADAPVTVRAHPALLAGLLDNLIDNALLHGRPLAAPADGPAAGTPCVTVGLARAGQQVRLFVEDNGPGIPEGEQVKVFERLYGAPGGSGLGLSIVREYAQLMQAEVGVSAARGGCGARFEVGFRLA